MRTRERDEQIRKAIYNENKLQCDDDERASQILKVYKRVGRTTKWKNNERDAARVCKNMVV